MQQHTPDFWELEKELDRKNTGRKGAEREVFAGGSAGGHVCRSGHPGPGEPARRAPSAARTKEHAMRASARPPADANGRTKVRKAAPAKAAPTKAAPARDATPRKGGGPGGGKPPIKTTAKIVAGNILKCLLVLVCIGVIAFSIVAVQIGAYVADATADDDTLLNLESFSLPENGVIQARDPATGEWTEYYKLVSRNANRIWVPLHQIPQVLIDAVVAIEDREYYEHGGVNWGRTFYAAANEVLGFQDTFGASTITQQLVKNITGEDEVLDEEGSALGGYKRKMKEIVRAQYLDKTYGKDLVMEAYLNTISLSGTIIGVQAGAKEYFNKDVSELTLSEAALIAGITQSPGRYNPFTNPDNALARRNTVLENMVADEKITRAEADAAKAEGLGLYEGPVEEDEGTANEVTSYFVDAVFNEVVQDIMDAGYADTREAAVNFYYTQGLQIQCTVDLTLQAEMERVYREADPALFPELPVEAEVEQEDGSVAVQTVTPQSAMAVVDYNGALVGVVGGLGEKTESLGLNRATQSVRQVGSTMKPIGAYALGIDYGVIDFSRLLPDTYVDAAAEWPKNYPGLYAPSGNNVVAADALAESLNTCAAHVGEWVGVDPMYEFLTDTLEISTLVPEGSVNDMSLAPLVLGSMTEGMIPAELAASYVMFGGNETYGYGIFTSLHTYERVLDSAGNVILEPDIVTMQAISPESGYIMNRMLRGVLDNPVGTANGMALTTTDSVGKTGTTSDEKDRWFVGLTPNYVAAVWWGYDENQTIEWSPNASTNSPPNVWRTVMENVQANMEYKEFPARPDGVQEQRYCRQSGLLAGAACSSTGVGYYAADNLPAVCDAHGAAANADGDNGEEDDGDDDG